MTLLLYPDTVRYTEKMLNKNKKYILLFETFKVYVMCSVIYNKQIIIMINVYVVFSIQN